MNNQQLNNLVTRYQSERSDEVFNQLYAMVSANWRSLRTVASSVLSNEADILAAYEDVLLICIENYDGRGDFINLLNRCIWRKRNDIYKVAKGRKKYEAIIPEMENEDGSTAATFELADEFNLEDFITTKKKADQRQLIDSLLNGADETTTAIVVSFMQHPKPTPTAIGKVLGIHHSVVIRKLERLAGKFDSKKFGDYRDFLAAM
jgi:DNA-directed RNA polymerase specialized sigma24 family protein